MMEIDNDHENLIGNFAALSLAAADHASASGDVEKTQIAEKLTELTSEIQRILSRCTPSTISVAFSPEIFENWLIRLSRAPPNSNYFDTSIDILKTCLSSIEWEKFFSNYSPSCTKRLESAEISPELKEYILKEISGFFDRIDSNAVAELARHESFGKLLSSIVSCLNDPNTVAISESATKCLSSFCRNRRPQSSAVRALFSFESVVERLRAMLGAKETVRFRLFELISVLCVLDEDAMKLCSQYGFVDGLLKELDADDDILCRLNALELLTEMGASKRLSGSDHCLRYFHDKGIMQKLNNMIMHAQESPDASFLFPAVIKFFGHLSLVYPQECCEGFPLFMSSVFNMVLNYNHLEVGQRLLAFDTLGSIGSTAEGKRVLAKHDEAMRKCMLCFGSSFKQGPMELRVRHLEALGSLLDVKASDQSNELLALIERWFSCLERGGQMSDACKLLFDLFRQPFPEMHLTAGNTFKILAAQPWAQKAMAQQAGFLEFMLNRATENTMEGRHIKYDIVKLLVESSTIDQAFDEADLKRLNEYAREGPFYIKAMPPDVAFMEA